MLLDTVSISAATPVSKRLDCERMSAYVAARQNLRPYMEDLYVTLYCCLVHRTHALPLPPAPMGPPSRRDGETLWARRFPVSVVGVARSGALFHVFSHALRARAAAGAVCACGGAGAHFASTLPPSPPPLPFPRNRPRGDSFPLFDWLSECYAAPGAEGQPGQHTLLSLSPTPNLALSLDPSPPVFLPLPSPPALLTCMALHCTTRMCVSPLPLLAPWRPACPC